MTSSHIFVVFIFTLNEKKMLHFLHCYVLVKRGIKKKLCIYFILFPGKSIVKLPCRAQATFNVSVCLSVRLLSRFPLTFPGQLRQQLYFFVRKRHA